MKQKALVLYSISMLTLFGCSAGNKSLKREFNIHPENFSRIETTVNDKPGFGFFNLAYKDYKYKQKYPYLIIITIELNPEYVSENGLPIKSEEEIALKILDELKKTTPVLVVSHYVGYLFNDSNLYAYIYLAKPDVAWRFLGAKRKNGGLARKFDFQTIDDPEWITVDRFLN